MRLFLAVLVVLLASSQVAARPNIVVIRTDDQEDTGSMDYMPRLHALIVERGITFKNSFVDLPLCAPSRASFLTGQAADTTYHWGYPDNLKDRPNIPVQSFSGGSGIPPLYR
jgi:arylsulfatase A-like enzyme